MFAVVICPTSNRAPLSSVKDNRLVALNGGVTNYTYDSDPNCSTYTGDLVKKVDAVSNVTCLAYDAVHRLTAVTYPSGSYASFTPAKHFVYDSATVNSVVMTNVAGHLAEAYTCTGTCSTKLTDLGFSYSTRGEVLDVYESTPNSGGCYHASAGAHYWANGLLQTLNLYKSGGTTLIPQVTYNPDGEGRVASTSVTSGQNPLTSTNYNLFGEPTAVNFGSLDSDSFQYDSNTGRMTQYNFSVNGRSDVGNLGWNTNGTLATLGITDALNSLDTQSCTYGYDDLARITKQNCGSVWSQTFGADMFGNLTKAGSVSFNAGYVDQNGNTSNRVVSVGTVIPGYDANGNLQSDGVNTYAWDADGNMRTVNSSTVTYDALDRVVEVSGSPSTQVVFDPLGNKLALM